MDINAVTFSLLLTTFVVQETDKPVEVYQLPDDFSLLFNIYNW